MVLRVAFRAQRDEVVRCISARLPALDVVYMQFTILGLPLAALAFMTVSTQHVFTYIAETQLFSLLVVGTLR